MQKKKKKLQIYQTARWKYTVGTRWASSKPSKHWHFFMLLKRRLNLNHSSGVSFGWSFEADVHLLAGLHGTTIIKMGGNLHQNFRVFLGLLFFFFADVDWKWGSISTYFLNFFKCYKTGHYCGHGAAVKTSVIARRKRSCHEWKLAEVWT